MTGTSETCCSRCLSHPCGNNQELAGGLGFKARSPARLACLDTLISTLLCMSSLELLGMPQSDKRRAQDICKQTSGGCIIRGVPEAGDIIFSRSTVDHDTGTTAC